MLCEVNIQVVPNRRGNVIRIEPPAHDVSSGAFHVKDGRHLQVESGRDGRLHHKIRPHGVEGWREGHGIGNIHDIRV